MESKPLAKWLGKKDSYPLSQSFAGIFIHQVGKRGKKDVV